MAYRQNHDPYYGAQQQDNYAQYLPPRSNTGVVDYPPAQPAYPPSNDYDAHTNWDGKSAKSYHSMAASSQVHLNPNPNPYEMSQVNVPAMPQVPYQQQQYPPQRPGMYRDPSSAGWSVAKEKLMKRRSVKQVQLTRGNLVLDVQVPSHIVPAGKQDIEEFSKMRYTAATCDPDDFQSSRYSLRPYLLNRETELFIVMTMYNEDEVLFVKTMNSYVFFNLLICSRTIYFCSVIKNITHLCSRSRSKMWGPEGWKKVVVCVVSDGRSKINKRTLQVLSLVKFHFLNYCFTISFICRWDVIKKALQKTPSAEKMSQPTFSSMFTMNLRWHEHADPVASRYTSSVIVTDTGEVSQGTCPVQILFCLKEQNKKKLNSHRWFFNAFGPLIKPNVCILLDVGTKPTGTSIYELWKCMCGQPCDDSN